MVLVPRDTPGLTITRHLPTFGYQDQHGHSELRSTTSACR
jgi:acyl-CoA dehydrogenase